MMPTIKVAKAFNFLDSDLHLHRYEVGEHDVSEEVANHWFVKANLEGFVPPEPTPGTPDYVATKFVHAGNQAAAMAAEQARQTAAGTMQKPAPLPADTVVHKPGEPPAHYFAGKPQHDQPMPQPQPPQPQPQPQVQAQRRPPPTR
jgi:hypothetical protein